MPKPCLANKERRDASRLFSGLELTAGLKPATYGVQIRCSIHLELRQHLCGFCLLLHTPLTESNHLHHKHHHQCLTARAYRLEFRSRIERLFFSARKKCSATEPTEHINRTHLHALLSTFGYSHFFLIIGFQIVLLPPSGNSSLSNTKFICNLAVIHALAV